MHTRILIIDDEQRSEGQLPRLTLHHASPADVSEQHDARDPGTEARDLRPPGVAASGDQRAVLRVHPSSEDTVLDKHARLVRDILARAEEMLSLADDRHERSLRGHDEGDIAIDLPTQTVWRSGRPVRLSPTEFRLLVALVRGRGAVVSRGNLRRDVWPGGTDVQPRVIDTHIARLRRKLEDDPRRPRHILTAVAAGYRFLA